MQRQVGRIPKITGSSFPRHKGAVARQDVNCTVQQRGRIAQLLSNLVQFNHQWRIHSGFLMRSKGQSFIHPSAIPCSPARLRGICHRHSTPSAPATPRSRGEACRTAGSEARALQAPQSPRLTKWCGTGSSSLESTRRSPVGVTCLDASWQLPGSSSEHRCQSTRRFCWVGRVTTLKRTALGKRFRTAQSSGRITYTASMRPST